METQPSAKEKSAHFPLRTTFVVAAVLLLLVGLAVWFVNHQMDAFFHGFVAGEPGPAASPADWPKPLKALVADAKAEEDRVAVKILEVQCMCQGWEKEFIWRMESTPGLFDFLKKRWALSAMPSPERGIFCGYSMYSGDETPSWWTPKERKGTEFYACRRTIASEAGDRFQVAVDDERQLIFVHYYEMW